MSSAPALMKPTWSETTASGARRFASSGQRRRGTALETRAPIPPSATIGGPLSRRSRNRFAMRRTLLTRKVGEVAQSSAERVIDEAVFRSDTPTTKTRRPRCGGGDATGNRAAPMRRGGKRGKGPRRPGAPLLKKPARGGGGAPPGLFFADARAP